MTSPIARLYFHRLVSIIVQGVLLVAGTVLFAFGMFEVFNFIALVSIALAWFAFRPAAARALTAVRFDTYDISHHLDAKGARKSTKDAPGLTQAQYSAPLALRVRRNARKALTIPRDPFELTQAILMTVLWMSYFGFISSVLAGA